MKIKEETKKCEKCNKIKPIEEFTTYPLSGGKKIDSVCGQCIADENDGYIY